MAAPIDLRNDFDSVSLSRRGPGTRPRAVEHRRRRSAVAGVGFIRRRSAEGRATVGRELKALGFAKISARPRHYAQNELAVEAFKKTSPPNWRRSGRG